MKKKTGKMSHDFLSCFSATMTSYALSQNAKRAYFLDHYCTINMKIETPI